MIQFVFQKITQVALLESRKMMLGDQRRGCGSNSGLGFEGLL